MSLKSDEQKAHSAEYFGEYRDYWWNRDFLDLMAQRLRLGHVRNVLDVGCGIGHWGQLLASVLDKDSLITGVDLESDWITKARERAKSIGLGERCRYELGDVTKLKFEENQFDLVTCQTVLIHMKEPMVALREMLRVLRPEGVLFIAEPNNFASHTVMSSLTEGWSVDEVIERLKFNLTVERGKQALGLGFNSVGDLIPGYLNELGAVEIDVFISDKATPFFPPYASQEQQVNIRQAREWASRGFIGWSRQELREYFLAGGGEEKEFDHYFDICVQDSKEMISAIEKQTYHSAGGALTYLIAARKRGSKAT